MGKLLMKAFAAAFVVLIFSTLACLLSPDSPGLLYPPDGDTISGSQVTFSWSAVEDATNYKLEISSDEYFTSTAVSEDSVDGTSYTVDLGYATSPLNGQSTYYWHVASFKEGWGSWSGVRSFYNANQEHP
ncbi:hypothetical protein KAX06_08890 [candidate division WOR-3 bacterium]|nr:hypothetical protein [candidate division WOR-3 bacterium]